MRVNNKKGAMIGTLVAKVEVLEALVAGKTPTVELAPMEYATSAKVANKGGYKVNVIVELTDGAGATIPYNGALDVKAVSNASGTVKAPKAVLLKNGHGEFYAEYTGTWAGGNTCTYTVGQSDEIIGKAVTHAEIIDTFVE